MLDLPPPPPVMPWGETKGQNIYKYSQMFKFTFKFTLTSLGGHNLVTFYAMKMAFGMLITQTKTINYMLRFPLSHSLWWVKGQNV